MITDSVSIRTRARPDPIVLLAIAGFFSGAALRICDGLLPRIARDFGVTPGVAGHVVISFSIGYGLSQLLFGPLGDRFGKLRHATKR